MKRKYIAMDLGTANTLVFIQSQGIVLNEPSTVAVDTLSGKVLAVGKEAHAYIGKVPHNIEVIRPLKDGCIADFDMAQTLIANLLQKIIGKWSIRKPHMIICVPINITGVERRAVIDTAKRAGAHEVRLIEEPIAAAIGASLPVLEPIGSMIVDIGGGTTDIAVISMGEKACAQSVRVAGDALNKAVQRYLQEHMQIFVGEIMAEKIKMTLGSLETPPEPLIMEISGKHITNSGPTNLKLDHTHVQKAITPVIDIILKSILDVLEQTPPELSADIMQQGILLTGGGSLIQGLNTCITNLTGLPVNVDRTPLTTVINGAGATLDDIARYKQLLLE